MTGLASPILRLRELHGPLRHGQHGQVMDCQHSPVSPDAAPDPLEEFCLRFGRRLLDPGLGRQMILACSSGEARADLQREDP
jgi:hypothetical protein